MGEDVEDLGAGRERGAEGRRATARALDELGPGWTVLHDVDWPGRPQSGHDKVVIGPAGVFVVATETWTGAVRLDSGVLQQNGQPRVQSTATAAEAARAVGALLATSVTPVLCLAGRRIGGLAGAVVVCSTHGLVPMLESRASVLCAEEVEALVAVARCRLAYGQLLPSAPAPRARVVRRTTFRLTAPRGPSTA